MFFSPLAKLVLCLVLATGVVTAASDCVEITLKNNTEAEQQTKAQLKKLLAAYNLSGYTFTHQVVIDEKAIPHSHPVLTLHTRHLGSDDELLSTYVHEQIHWYLTAHESATRAAETALRKIYSKVPVGYPDGANDEESTYLHLVVCYLELQADRRLMGPERAAAVMNFWAGDHYRWVYRTVLQDETRIGKIVQNESLVIK